MEDDRKYKPPLKPSEFTVRQMVKRDSNIAWLKLLNIPFDESVPMISIKIQGRQIDFWPASDCYYLHSKKLYDNGIGELVNKILEYQK